MKAYVYADKGLERYAGRFVWLSIDTEDAANAAFLERYPIPVLPTLLVLDARRDTVALRYIGGATVPQLKKLLEESEQTYRARSQSAADALLTKADRLASEGKHADSAKAYDEAIAAAPQQWSRLGRAAESLIFALAMSRDHARCAGRAVALYPRVRGSMSSANVAATGLGCAASLGKEHAQRIEYLDALEQATREVFDDPKIVLSDDDRSGLYLALIEAADASGDDEGVIALRVQWSRFLDDAAARAKTPEQRTVYDSHRLTAYIELGTPEKAIPMLEQSERDFPGDYNPPSRLAAAYKAMKEYDQALAASDRALARVSGPRRVTVLNNRADLFTAKGDRKAARETLEEALAYAKALPAGQRSEGRIKSLEKKIAGLK